MKSKLFVEAAKLVSNGTQFSCNAIGYANGKEDSYVHCDEIPFYSNLFGITSWATFNGMFRETFGRQSTNAELKEIRILALLLAGEVLKSEKKSFAKSVFGAKFKRLS